MRVQITTAKIKRDGSFRSRVLDAYGTSCAICGYDKHVDAAHLVAKHVVDDDSTENGAPLCPNHHWELDHGHITVDDVMKARSEAYFKAKKAVA